MGTGYDLIKQIEDAKVSRSFFFPSLPVRCVASAFLFRPFHPFSSLPSFFASSGACCLGFARNFNRRQRPFVWRFR
jgi:hypothetical protein